MRRREFITILGGAAATWPVAVRAQQPALPVVGFLSSRSPDESANVVAAFRRGVAENGFIEGQTVAIDYRWAMGQYDRLPELAAELVRVPVAVLVSVGGEPSARAAKAATTTVPVVSLFSTDPVRSGLIASLSRPGGNVTGISDFNVEMEPKRLSLLRDLVPQAAVFGVLLNPDFPPAAEQLRAIQAAAQTLGVPVRGLTGQDRSRARGGFRIRHAAAHPRAAGGQRSVLRLAARATRCARGAPWRARDVHLSRLCRGRRADELRNRSRGHVPSSRRLCRPHP